MLRDDGVWDWQHRAWKFTCLECGNEFYARCQDALYDKPNCRKAASRRKDKIRGAANQAISHIGYIRRLATNADLQFVAAIELERVAQALNVTTAGRTDTRVDVTLAVRTDKACAKCGKVTTVSPASGLCIDCIRGSAVFS